MINGLEHVLVTHKLIIAVIVAAAAILSYTLPINSIMASVSHSGNVQQSISQLNSISGGGYGNVQINDAHNFADVHISSHGGKVSHSGNVDQSISQTNSISSSGTGSANNNFQQNTASNTADVHISSHGHHYKGGGGKVSHSGNVDQSISQTNSIDAGSGTSHDNIQSNSASNTADVHIHSK
jgi:hypothetical protein